jgi:death-on-curing protein
LETETIHKLHRKSLERFGGADGVRDVGLVESAIAAAENAYCYGHADFSMIAATYAFHIAQAQAFLDGNKRTAALAALTFLDRNNVAQTPSNMEIYNALIAIAEKRLDKAGFAELFRRAANSAS